MPAGVIPGALLSNGGRAAGGANGRASYQSQAGNYASNAYNQGQQNATQAQGQYGQLASYGSVLQNLAGPAVLSLLQSLFSEIGVNSPGGNTNNTGAPQAHPNQNVQQTNPQADPYALTQPEQVQLNQQIDTLNKGYQATVNQTQAALTARGIDPNSEAGLAAMEYLQSNHTSNVAQTQATFEENIRQSRIQQTESALQTVLGIGGQGTAALGSGASGQAGLASTQFNASAQQGQVAMADAGTNLGASALSDLGSILGEWAGGGFNTSGLTSLFGGSGGGSGGASSAIQALAGDSFP